MKRVFSLAAILGMVAVVLQGTVVPHFAIFGGRINLLVAVVSAVALGQGAMPGLFTGLWVGLLADTALGTVPGMAALPLVVLGYGLGLASKYIYRDAFLVPVIIGFGGVAFFEIMIWFLSNVAFAVWWRNAFLAAFIPTVLINGALMPWVHMAIMKIMPLSREEVS